MLTGPDVSSYQGKVDFQKVAAAGHVFAFVKATEGVQYTSSTWAAQWKGAREAGLLRGPYHFLRPVEDPIAQVDRFVSVVQKTKDAPELPYTLDFEAYQGTIGVQPQVLVDSALKSLTRLEQLVGHIPLLYCGSWFFRLLKNGYKLKGLKPAKNVMELTKYPLWQPDYAGEIEPMPWPTSFAGKWWTFHQHTGRGACPGVVGNCDLNRFAGSEEELSSLIHNTRSE